MLESHPPRSPGSAIGYLLMAGFVLLDLCLLVLLVSEPIRWLSVVWGGVVVLSFPALALIGFWVAALGQASYQLIDGQWLVIEWGQWREVVAIQEIEQVVAGSRPVTHFRGVRWPGYWLGVGQLADWGQPVRLFATRPEPRQLLIITQTTIYAISPIDRDLFQRTLEAFVATPHPDSPLQEADQPPPTSQQPAFLNWPLWQDRPVQWLLSLTALLCFTLFVYVAVNYGRLPAEIPLHFAPAGTIDRVGSPAGLFIPPLVALVGGLVNGLVGLYFYGRESDRPVALLLWAASLVGQLLAWVAVAHLLMAP